MLMHEILDEAERRGVRIEQAKQADRFDQVSYFIDGVHVRLDENWAYPGAVWIGRKHIAFDNPFPDPAGLVDEIEKYAKNQGGER